MIISILPFVQILIITSLSACQKDLEFPDLNKNNDTIPMSGSGTHFYKEFPVEMKETDSWRVTDPNSTYSGNSSENPYKYLPNPEIEIPDVVVANAFRAEAIIDRWGGHTGTSGHQMRFNNNDWISIPIRLEGTHKNPEWYNYQDNPLVTVPLSNLKNGMNMLEGTSGPQTKYANTWGQWGWYSLILRVYYPYTTDLTARFGNVSDGGSLTANPQFSIEVNHPDEVEKISIRGIYRGPDENGDGKYDDLHGMYHYTGLQGIIGVANQHPFQVTWDTEWIPDQSGDISVIAYVKLKNGYSFAADRVSGLNLRRTGNSVKMYTAESVPEKFWVRNNRKCYCFFTIPESEPLGKAIEARMFIRTWNGNNNEKNGTPFRINDNSWMKVGGANHNFDFRMVEIPVEHLQHGLNRITFTSSTIHHGCEILWPGPTILVKYGK